MTIKTYLISVALIVSFLFGFSILTDDDGRYRSYRKFELPFVYFMHHSTPDNFLEPIQQGAQSWNAIPGSYFEFAYGGMTHSNSVVNDDTSLVYFDSNHENFEQGTSTIAFSSTFVTGYSTPNYRAVESDLIWNSADFPPSTTGAAGAQDLQSVITHEFGHHLGLGHAGEPGSPPGVGDVIPEATMYGFSSDGDTSKRSLHIDDILGLVSIYPRWRFSGTVTDSVTGELLDFATYYLNGQQTANISSVVLEAVYQRAGYVSDELEKVNDGTAAFSFISLNQTPLLTVSAFGYQDKNIHLYLGSSSVIDTTVMATIALSPKPKHAVTFKLIDNTSSQLIANRAVITASSDVLGTNIIESKSNQDKETELILSEDLYSFQIYPELPYPYIGIKDLVIKADTTIQLEIEPAAMALIEDIAPLSSDTRQGIRDFYMDNVTTNGFANQFALVELPRDSISDSLFQLVPLCIWYANSNTEPKLFSNTSLLQNYLAQGGKLILSGDALFNSGLDSAFAADYLHVRYAGTSTTQLLRGVEGDPIGNNEFIGINKANAQRMEKLADPGSTDVFKYLGTAYAGAVKFDGSYRLVLFSFGVEQISKNYLKPETVFERSLNWILDPTAIHSVPEKIPDQVIISEAFPNPFNPSTYFSLILPKSQVVEITIYNLLGQKIINLYSGRLTPGEHRFHWDGMNSNGTSVTSGVYLININSASMNIPKKVVLIR